MLLRHYAGPISATILLAVVLFPHPIHAAPGDIKWKFSPINATSFASTPAIGDDGTIYVCSLQRTFYALNPDGSMKWSQQTGGPIFGSPVLSDDDILFIGSRDKFLHAVNAADGSIKWKKNLGAAIDSTAALSAEGSIFIGCSNGVFHKLSPEDGSELWRYKTGGIIASSPAVAEDGTVYSGSQDYHLYAFAQSSNTTVWSRRVGERMNSSPAPGKDGSIYIGTNNFPAGANQTSMFAYTADGTNRWKFKTGNIVPGSAVVGEDNTVYFISKDAKLYALDSDGSLRWSYAIGGLNSRSTPALGADGTIFAASSSGTIFAVNPDGTLKWSTFLEAGTNMGSPSIAPDGTIYVSAGGGNFFALESDCGGLADTTWPKLRCNLKNTGRYRGGILADTTQATGTTATINRSLKKTQTAATLQNSYKGLADFVPQSKVYSFNASVAPSEANATFYFSCSDLNGTAGEFWLYKLKDSGEILPFAGYSGRTGNRSDGMWWFTDSTGNTVLNAASTLNTGTWYRVWFTIRDNGAYDLNSTKGVIRDPLLLGRFPVLNGPDRKTGILPCVSSASLKQEDSTSLYIYAGGESFTPFNGLSAFNATVDPPDSLSVFRFNSSKLYGNVTDLTLMKFFDANLTTRLFAEYTAPSAGSATAAEEGQWWITHRNNTPVGDESILTLGTFYFVNFAIRDNGPYDADPEAGSITDPLALGTVEGGGSGGCMVDPESRFDMEWLMILLLPGIALLRRRG